MAFNYCYNSICCFFNLSNSQETCDSLTGLSNILITLRQETIIHLDLVQDPNLHKSSNYEEAWDTEQTCVLSYSQKTSSVRFIKVTGENAGNDSFFSPDKPMWAYIIT